MDIEAYMRESAKVERQRAFAKKQANPLIRERVLQLLEKQQAELDAEFAKHEQLTLKAGK